MTLAVMPGAWRRSESWMAIYDPTPFLTPTDRRLLLLLGQLVLQSEGVDRFTNRVNDRIDLSDSEASELLELLEGFVSTKRFQETSYLLEELFSGPDFDSKRLREIYLSWRRFHGKSRALATDQWDLVLSRLGIAPRHYGASPWYRKDAAPMSLDHFLRMEQKLASASGVSPRVQQLIVSYVRLQFGYINSIREGEDILKEGQIKSKPVEIIQNLYRDSKSRVGFKPLSTSKIAATMTIVLDLSAAYTTRDWSVASFLSTIAGAAPAAVMD